MLLSMSPSLRFSMDVEVEVEVEVDMALPEVDRIRMEMPLLELAVEP